MFAVCRTIKFNSSNQKRKIVVEEEIVEEPDSKISKVSSAAAESAEIPNSKTIECPPSNSLEMDEVKKRIAKNTWSKSVGIAKSKMIGLVKLKKPQDIKQEATNSSTTSDIDNKSKNSDSKGEVQKSQTPASGLSLLGAYSDSENSE